MFEKFSVLDIDSAGRGGEYTVQAGFGWTNGVVLWVADTYGAVLNKPACPDLLASADAIGGSSASASGTASAGGSASASGTSAGASGSATSGVRRVGGGAGWALGAVLGAVLLCVL
jgi:alpha,alpha-trehalase